MIKMVHGGRAAKFHFSIYENVFHHFQFDGRMGPEMKENCSIKVQVVNPLESKRCYQYNTRYLWVIGFSKTICSV